MNKKIFFILSLVSFSLIVHCSNHSDNNDFLQVIVSDVCQSKSALNEQTALSAQVHNESNSKSGESKSWLRDQSKSALNEESTLSAQANVAIILPFVSELNHLSLGQIGRKKGDKALTAHDAQASQTVTTVHQHRASVGTDAKLNFIISDI